MHLTPASSCSCPFTLQSAIGSPIEISVLRKMIKIIRRSIKLGSDVMTTIIRGQAIFPTGSSLCASRPHSLDRERNIALGCSGSADDIDAKTVAIPLFNFRNRA